MNFIYSTNIRKGEKLFIPMNDLVSEYKRNKNKINKAIFKVINSGNFTLGEEVELFEKEFANFCGSKYAVGGGSGTSALHLSLIACGIGQGDEVITVPNTDIPTAMSISHVGAKIIFVDVDYDTFNIDTRQLEQKITKFTKAIIPVHIFGLPADMTEINRIAKKYNLKIIEDAALATGAEVNGIKVGSLGDVGCFSLAPNKILGAYGDAGVITTNKKYIADKIKISSNYGHSLKMNERKYGVGKKGITKWELLEEGYNERLDTLQASILRVKLSMLKLNIKKRIDLANNYTKYLSQKIKKQKYSNNFKHVYRAYPCFVKKKNYISKKLSEKGISTNSYYTPPLHLQPAYKRLGLKKGSFPVSEELSKELICLPIYPSLSKLNQEYIINNFNKLIN